MSARLTRPLVAAVAAAALAGALAACLPGGEARVTTDGDGSAPGEALAACSRDDECALAAASCCGCPAFAVRADDPALLACEGVACDDPGACDGAVRAACAAGECVIACAAVACPATCAGGFAVDAAGCLTCACGGADAAGQCSEDADCVQTRADCCGCALGGVDTAVLASERAAYDATLGCAPAPACPALDRCEPGAVPRCVGGACELSAPAPLPPGACGRPELPACPAGQACVLNASEDATRAGVGVCVAG